MILMYIQSYNILLLLHGLFDTTFEANIVLHLPVVWQTRARERFHARETLGLGKKKDGCGWMYPLFAVFTDFTFLYQGAYLAFAILSILFRM